MYAHRTLEIIQTLIEYSLSIFRFCVLADSVAKVFSDGDESFDIVVNLAAETQYGRAGGGKNSHHVAFYLRETNSWEKEIVCLMNNGGTRISKNMGGGGSQGKALCQGVADKQKKKKKKKK